MIELLYLALHVGIAIGLGICAVWVFKNKAKSKKAFKDFIEGNWNAH